MESNQNGDNGNKKSELKFEKNNKDWNRTKVVTMIICLIGGVFFILWFHWLISIISFLVGIFVTVFLPNKFEIPKFNTIEFLKKITKVQFYRNIEGKPNDFITNQEKVFFTVVISFTIIIAVSIKAIIGAPNQAETIVLRNGSESNSQYEGNLDNFKKVYAGNSPFYLLVDKNLLKRIDILQVKGIVDDQYTIIGYALDVKKIFNLDSFCVKYYDTVDGDIVLIDQDTVYVNGNIGERVRCETSHSYHGKNLAPILYENCR